MSRHLSFTVLLVMAALLALVLTLPLAVLLLRAFSINPLSALMQSPARQALALSLFTTTISLAIIVLLGTPLAYLLTLGDFPGKAWLETLLDLPVVLPPAVAGLALLLTFGRRGPVGLLLGALGVSLPFTTAAVVLAQVFVAAPFYVRAVRVGFLAVPPSLMESALTEGADTGQMLRYVFLPLAWRALVSGMVLAGARALGEFGATLMFAGNLPGVTQTMPLAIYLGLEQNLQLALVLAALLVGIAVLALRALRTLEAGAADES